jgi:hypothetical protein
MHLQHELPIGSYCGSSKQIAQIVVREICLVYKPKELQFKIEKRRQALRLSLRRSPIRMNRRRTGYPIRRMQFSISIAKIRTAATTGGIGAKGGLTPPSDALVVTRLC